MYSTMTDPLQTAKFLAILLLSTIFTGALSIPFINLLYKLKFRAPKTTSKDFLGKETPFAKLHGKKIGTPTGGGILIAVSTFLFSAIFYALTSFRFNWTSNILFLTIFSFGLLGLYDDLQKFFKLKKRGFFSLRLRHKFLVQWILGLAISWLLYTEIGGLENIWLPGGAALNIGLWFVPLGALAIVATSNAFNITDGLDGLAGGLLVIALGAFTFLATRSPLGGDITVFIAVLVGSLLAFLYFNIHPARIFMGDTGALAFGALLGVIALMTNRLIALPIIGGVFAIETISDFIQWGSMLFRDGKKVFKIAPLHHHFEAIGWEETKVTMRFWLAGTLLALLGTLVASL